MLCTALYFPLRLALAVRQFFQGDTITPVDILTSQRVWQPVHPNLRMRYLRRADVLSTLWSTWDAKKQVRNRGGSTLRRPVPP